jgi:DNA-binding transcriptional ArsR family regulator
MCKYVYMQEKTEIFKALADPTRLRIVEFLLPGERCVCEIIPHTGRAQSTVSLQLAKLENLGILRSRRDGKKIFYHISNDKAKKILECTKDED